MMCGFCVGLLPSLVAATAACTDPCGDNQYCCPDAHTCMTPAKPGTLCKHASECSSYGPNTICCPTTHECVHVGKSCTPPIEDKPAWVLPQ